MNRAAFSIVTVITLLFSCSCRTIQVGMDNAYFQHGYLNSRLLVPGTLFLYDTSKGEQNALNFTVQLDVSNNEMRLLAGGRKTSTTAASGLSLTIPWKLGPVPSGLEATVHRETRVSLENYRRRTFVDPAYVLNQDTVRDIRASLGRDFAGNDNIRFILVSGDVIADSAEISIGQPTDKQNEFVINYAGQKYKGSRSRSTRHSTAGTQETVFVSFRVYKLVRDSRGATGYRFVEDRGINPDFTELLTKGRF